MVSRPAMRTGRCDTEKAGDLGDLFHHKCCPVRNLSYDRHAVSGISGLVSHPVFVRSSCFRQASCSWLDVFDQDCIESVGLLKRDVVSGCFEPNQLLSWRLQCVEIAGCDCGVDLPIVSTDA